MCVRTLPASAATEAAFPGLAIDRIEAEKTRKHASLIERYRPGDQFVPVVTDEHGALALTYGMRRLAVVAARRMQVPRLPAPSRSRSRAGSASTTGS